MLPAIAGGADECTLMAGKSPRCQKTIVQRKGFTHSMWMGVERKKMTSVWQTLVFDFWIADSLLHSLVILPYCDLVSVMMELCLAWQSSFHVFSRWSAGAADVQWLAPSDRFLLWQIAAQDAWRAHAHPTSPPGRAESRVYIRNSAQHSHPVAVSAIGRSATG